MNRRAENRKRKLFCGAWILAGTLLLGALTGCGGEPAVTVLPGTSVESTVSPSETPSSATGTTEPSSETKTPVSTQGNTEPPSSSSGASTQTPTVVPVSGVTVAPKVLTLKVGDEWELTVRVLPENADDRTVTYQSSNEKVALCAEGKVTALAAGSAEITVSSADGLHSAKCTVTVEEKNPIPENKRYDPLTGLPTYTPVFEEGVSYVEYNTKLVRHIFCHNLVAYEGATGADAEDYYKNCLTVTEFNRILDQLYERGYVLIDIDYMYEYAYDQNGMLTAKIKPTIKIPAGKKPLVLSVDNVAYPRREHGLGRVDRLQVVDGKLVTYTRFADGSEKYGEDDDVFPILENFIKAHPDFSFSGAKCVVAPSGADGLFGWDTVPGSANYEQSVLEAGKVAKWFIDNGYALACHSYYHKSFADMTVEQIQEDFAKWKEEVLPIIGRTHVFIYPFGAFTPRNSEQAKALSAEGYAVFCSTAMNAVNWDNFPLQGNVYNERITLSSAQLYKYRDSAILNELFDPYTVYDNDAHEKKLYQAV